MFKNTTLYLTLLFLLSSCFKEDTSPPVISLYGDTKHTVIIGNDYIEPGFSASDNKDGDISYLVNVTELPQTEIAGIYNLIYNVSDASGNKAKEISRTVYVTHNNSTLSNIYSAHGLCAVSYVNNDNYFVAIESDNLNSKSMFLIGFNNLSQENKIKAVITDKTGELIDIPEQIIQDTLYYGTARVNSNGSEIILDINKKFNGSIDSCTTVLVREIR